MAKAAAKRPVLPPAAVVCPRCGGAARREGVSVEEARADCPFCRHALDLSAPAVGARGPAVPAPPAGLSCTQCGAAVGDSSVEYLQGLARCRSCTTVLDLASGRNADWFRRQMAEKEGIPLPGRFRVTRSLGEVTLEFRVGWTPLAPYGEWILGALALAALGLLVAVLGGEPGLLLAVGGPSAAAAAFLLGLLVLRRRVAVRGGSLLLGWGPFLPWRRTVPRSSIDQLFVVRRTYSRRRRRAAEQWIDWVSGTEEETESMFALVALGRDGSRRRLLGHLADGAEAVFLERWIERRLGIADRHVPGERS